MLTIEQTKMLNRNGVFVCMDYEVIVQQQCDGDGLRSAMRMRVRSVAAAKKDDRAAAEPTA